MATNGWVLLSVDRGLLPGNYPEAPPSVVKLMLEQFSGAPGTTFVDSSAMLEFVGRRRDCRTCQNTRKVKCRECHGAGVSTCVCHCGFPHEAECDNCDEDGYSECPACSEGWRERPARFMGQIVNRTQLALVLCGHNGEPRIRCGVGRSKKTGDPVITLAPDVETPLWMALVMPMRDYVRTNVTFDDPATWSAATR